MQNFIQQITRQVQMSSAGQNLTTQQIQNEVQIILITLAVSLVVVWIPTIVGWWAIYRKAHLPGWAAIIPVYDNMVKQRLVGMHVAWALLVVPGWAININSWLLGMESPAWLNTLGVICNLAYLLVYLMVITRLSRQFGRGLGYAIFILFFPFIALPMLGFGKATLGAPPQ